MNSVSDQNETPIHSILSPEAVRLEVQVSGPGPRMLAYGIDALVIGVLILLVLLVVFMGLPIGAKIERIFAAGIREAANNAKSGKAAPTAWWAEGLALAILLLIQFVIETGYFIFWELATGGRSPGKFLVGLRVVRRNGLPIDIRSSVVRNLMRIVDMLPAQYVVGITAILLSPSGERLGDHVAGTIVIRLDRPETAPQITLPENTLALVLTRDQLARIGPRELQLLRGVLRRSSELPADRSSALVAEAADAMRKHLKMNDSVNLDDLTFLHGLLAAAEKSLRSD
jgi:uncharacterized RDD family membrane protein YckC